MGLAMRRGIRRRATAAAGPAVFLALTGYFLWQATQGSRGLSAIAARQQELAAATAELARVNADIATWQRRNAGLGGATLDPDVLDERARSMLNLARPDELVIPYAKDHRLF